MKVLVVELWGLGDAVMMTTVLSPLLDAGASVTVLCKPASAELLKPTYPAVEFILLGAPWTAFRGKYRLMAWPWRRLANVIREIRCRKFDLAASVRNDPRDHLLMFLAGAAKRIGFPRKGSGLLLTRKLAPPSLRSHRVERWRQIAGALLEPFPSQAQAAEKSRPFLDPAAYGSGTGLESRRPVVGLHCGAQVKLRRWAEKSFIHTVELLRREADFHLALFPDPDGYGRALIPLSDSCHEGLSLPQLAAELAACDLLICNDSGPGHIAAAFGRPILAIFGPGDPDWFRPFGEKNHVVIRDICPFRPCFDSCRFSQPICLTDLLPEVTWPEIREWFHQQLDNLTIDQTPR